MYESMYRTPLFYDPSNFDVCTITKQYPGTFVHDSLSHFPHHIRVQLIYNNENSCIVHLNIHVSYTLYKDNEGTWRDGCRLGSRAVEHVAEEALDRHVAHRLPEEELLQRPGAEGAHGGQQEQQAAEARAPAHRAVLGHHGVGLVGQRLHLQAVAQPARLCGHDRTRADNHYAGSRSSRRPRRARPRTEQYSDIMAWVWSASASTPARAPLRTRPDKSGQSLCGQQEQQAAEARAPAHRAVLGHHGVGLEQQAAEARAPAHRAVLGHHGVGLVGQRLHLQAVAQPARLCGHDRTRADNHYAGSRSSRRPRRARPRTEQYSDIMAWVWSASASTPARAPLRTRPDKSGQSLCGQQEQQAAEARAPAHRAVLGHHGVGLAYSVWSTRSAWKRATASSRRRASSASTERREGGDTAPATRDSAQHRSKLADDASGVVTQNHINGRDL
ncbi:Alanine--tRNA ligase, chloroplastic/mitochondrial [Frankliniella fusca]|uniref:Alanine--tRNA ligase, chloroplastic/mitochondrial n=1 Tax=Frankliniella fusca TaxID=407009 RepID=A0AAE1LLW8_9NEOP|nr:Alanine--tRNA ligase, chloroplastic/mitochondrial [Frankliniella fusca]